MENDQGQDKVLPKKRDKEPADNATVTSSILDSPEGDKDADFERQGGKKGTSSRTRQNQVVEIGVDSPAHPEYSCQGTLGETEEGTKTLCNLAQVDLAALCVFYCIDCPDQLVETPVPSTYQIANCLAILEDFSLPAEEKERLLRLGRQRPISTETWSRSFHFAMLQCKHIKEYIKNGRESTYYTLEEPIAGCTAEELNEALWLSMKPPNTKQPRRDLLLIPNSSIYNNAQYLKLQQADVATTGDDIRDMVSVIFQHQPVKQVIVLLPHGWDQRHVVNNFHQLQKAAEICKTLILVTPGLMVETSEKWTEEYKDLIEAYAIFKQSFDDKTQGRHVQLYGPRTHATLQVGTLWAMLGERLNFFTPQKTLSTIQMAAVVDTLRRGLRENGFNNGLYPTPSCWKNPGNQERKVPTQARRLNLEPPTQERRTFPIHRRSHQEQQARSQDRRGAHHHPYARRDSRWTRRGM